MNKPKKRVLLTGISGSIGTHMMIHIFHNTDWDIVGVATYQNKGIAERITEMLRMHSEYWERLTLVTHDLTKPFNKKVKKEIGNVDYIINLASLSDVWDSIENPVPFIENNIKVALNTLEFAREHWSLTEANHTPPEGSAFIQFSTDEVYGASGKDQQHPEWSAIVPSNPYSASKAAQEAIAISYWRTYGVPVIITNTMNNFGEYQQPSKYPVMIQKAVMAGDVLTIHGTPNNVGTRYYLHSRNASDAILFILNNLPPYQHDPGKVDRPDRYNIVGDKQLSNLELAETIARLMGKRLNYRFVDFHSTRPGHDLHYGLDGAKLKKLGWKSPKEFEASLKDTIEWQLDHPYWIS